MAGAVRRNDVPRRLGRERIQDLPLTPVEAFVLSQIDGRISVADLGLVVGLPAEELHRVLGRLVDLGLIQLGATPPPPPEETPGRPPGGEPRAGTGAAAARPGRPSACVSSEARDKAPGADVSAAAGSPRPAAGSSAASEWGTLTREERRRIETFLVRAESFDFYRLLGVNPGASRAEIRSAYFGLARQFHPDAYYGRDIGAARRRLERIFRQLTRAYEVLSRSKSRRAYDEYLQGQAILQGREEEEQAWRQEEERRRMVDGAPVASAAREAAGVEAEAAAAPTEEGGTAPTPATGGVPADGAPSEAGAEAGPRPYGELAPPPSSAEASTMVAGTPPSAAKAPPVPRSSAAENWRRLRTARQLAAVLRRPSASPSPRGPRGSDCLAEAEAAAQAEQWGRVFGLLEVAEKLGLSDAEQSRRAELRDRSARELARISFRQARFCESTGDLAAAMEHIERACRYGTDDAECWDAAARLGLRLGRDLHKARDAALRAIRLAPQTLDYRITLIRVYLAAGLVKNARREAEAALAIEPENQQVKALLAEARTQHE